MKTIKTNKKKKIKKINWEELDYKHTGLRGEFLLGVGIRELKEKINEIIDYLIDKKNE